MVSMMIAYYTVSPYPAKPCPIAFIVRIYSAAANDSQVLQDTRCVPVRNPNNITRSLRDAELLGDSLVASFVSGSVA